MLQMCVVLVPVQAQRFIYEQSFVVNRSGRRRRQSRILEPGLVQNVYPANLSFGVKKAWIRLFTPSATCLTCIALGSFFGRQHYRRIRVTPREEARYRTVVLRSPEEPGTWLYDAPQSFGL